MSLSEYREKAEHLSQPENFREALRDNWHIPAIGLIFALALWIRYLPEKGMKHLQALDPYMIYRMSQHLALSGNLPALDFTRYFPYATPTYVMNIGNIAIPAFIYKYLGFSLIFPNYLEFAQFYPALMGAVGVVTMYFLGKELFDRFTGVSAAFFLATLSGVMHRTSAGFFEKEPTGTAFMLLSMTFFIRSWKRRDWKNGILSGLTFGIFTISWGGSKALWLLYPMVVAAVLFIDEDIRSLIAAYTPTVLLGGFLASAFNPPTFWISGKYFLANIALLTLLWSRYLVEELEILEKDQLKYYVPSLTVAGGIMALLSPLYSERLGDLVFGLWNTATRSSSLSGGGAIGGTIAENQAASLSSMVNSLGGNIGAGLSGLNSWFISTFSFTQPVVEALSVVLNPLAGLAVFITSFVNPWTFMLLGTPLLATHLTLFLAKKYSLIEDISGETYYSYIMAVTMAWLVALTGFLASTELARALMQNPGRVEVLRYAGQLRFNSVIYGIISLAGLSGIVYYMKDEAYKILLLIFGFLAIGQMVAALNVVGARNIRVIIYALLNSPFAKGLLLPTLGAFTAFLVIYKLGEFRKPELEAKWYYAFPFFFLVTHLLGAASSSRLVFLAGFPVSLMAGYGFKIAYSKARVVELPEMEIEAETAEKIKKASIAISVALMIVLATFSGMSVAKNLGGSPSQAWNGSLSYMEEETPPGSVVLSWWDYGYWFQSIGRRGSVADGGNFGYYTEGTQKINYPLADFLTASNASDWKWFLRKHSVDYIALDRSMIGKYSAVSQIARNDNLNFSSMQTFTTRGSIRQYLNRPPDQRIVEFTSSRGGRAKALVPVDIEGLDTNNTEDLSIEYDGPITFRSGTATRKINCALTDEGRVKLGNTSERRTLDFCVAERPAPDFEFAARSGSSAGLVLVPEEITDHTLVRLYLMDGYGIDYLEKVQLGRLEYVKMWKVKDIQ